MANRAQLEHSFSLFPQLPVELQCRIWDLCLPTRVVELDLPTEGPTPCTWGQTSLVNSQSPVATRICPQSRSVAQLAGIKRLYSDSDNDVTREWSASNTINGQLVIPSTDVLHLWWCGWSDDVQDENHGNPLRVLLWLARQKYHMRMSIMASLMVDFGELEDTEIYSGFLEDFELLAEGGGPYLVTFAIVSLHVGLDTVLRTEGGMLFGRLGEERVKLVGAEDETALRAYYNLWKAGPVEDTAPTSFFDMAVQKHRSDWLSLLVHWKRKLVTKWLKHCWEKAERDQELGDITNPRGTWYDLLKKRSAPGGNWESIGLHTPPEGVSYRTLQYIPNESMV